MATDLYLQVFKLWNQTVNATTTTEVHNIFYNAEFGTLYYTSLEQGT